MFDMMKLDKWGQVENCFESAMTVRHHLIEKGACAIPLAVGHGTKFHISFVNLEKAIHPPVKSYEDGSNRGVQINIDRFGSYSLPWGASMGEETYLDEKWNIGNRVTAKDLLPFFNTVVSGKNNFPYSEIL